MHRLAVALSLWVSASAFAQQTLTPAREAGPDPSLAGGNCDDLTGLPIYQNVTWNEVWTALNDMSSCTQNCHLGSDAAAELDLGVRDLSIYYLVNQRSSQKDMLRVVPGDPAASLLLQKVSCPKPAVGNRMPFGAPIPRALQGMIYDWIEQGARGEAAEDPIPRDHLFRASYESLRR